ncbi:hypothetical protein GmHk_20G057689 [Glycine max]|nr:hypothetical protein GmHk_20G057689 [Glycine max]
MLLDVLRKTITNAIGGDNCVEYECMEPKRDNDVSKGLIDLNATSGRSVDEVFALLCKPRKLRYVDEIIAQMPDKSV